MSPQCAVSSSFRANGECWRAKSVVNEDTSSCSICIHYHIPVKPVRWPAFRRENSVSVYKTWRRGVVVWSRRSRTLSFKGLIHFNAPKYSLQMPKHVHTMLITTDKSLSILQYSRFFFKLVSAATFPRWFSGGNKFLATIGFPEQKGEGTVVTEQASVWATGYRLQATTTPLPGSYCSMLHHMTC